MKKAAFVLGMFVLVMTISAQVPAPPAASSWNGIEMVQTVSTCQLHGTDSVWCVGTDGVRYSYQGAAFVNPAAPANGGVQTVNGKKPDATGNVSLAATTTSTTTSSTTLQ